MLYSYWRIRSDGLHSPTRPRAYRSREDATRAVGPRASKSRSYRLVCLLVRPDPEQDRVVPELGLQGDRDWSLRASVRSDAVVIYGAIPQALWYEDK